MGGMSGLQCLYLGLGLRVKEGKMFLLSGGSGGSGGTDESAWRKSSLTSLNIPSVLSVSKSTAVATFTDAGEATISQASPGVVTKASHGLAADREVYFKTTGALPAGLTAFTHYYVKSPAENTFNVSLTAGGAAINTTNAGSGTHNLWTKDL